MSFSWELDALLYGLLTLAAITSVTAIGARLAKFYLPKPPPFDRKEIHLDPRDPYADLITSWQILDPLFMRNSEQSPTRSLVPRASRLRIIFIFIFVAILTVGLETTLILSTGTVTNPLKVPDVQTSTFIARFLGNGFDLRNIPVSDLDKDKCIPKKNFTVDERRYIEYSESLCVGRSEKTHNAGKLKNFTLRTERSVADNMQLWIGKVVKKPPGAPGLLPFDKKTYGTVRIKIDRRVVYENRHKKRFIDHQTALRISRVLEDTSGCSMKDIRDNEPLDNEILGRPANLAEYSCPKAHTVSEILDFMIPAALSAYALYDYKKSRMNYYIPGDAFYVREQEKLRVGVQHSQPYEIGWIVFMSILTLAGIIWWIVDMCMNRAVNPKIGLLSLMSEEVDDADCWTNELYRIPKVLYDQPLNPMNNSRAVGSRQTFAPNLSCTSTGISIPSAPVSSPMLRRSTSTVQHFELGTGVNVREYEQPPPVYTNPASSPSISPTSPSY